MKKLSILLVLLAAPEPPTDTFYRYEVDGEVHVVTRLDDVPPQYRSKATELVMSSSRDEAPPRPPPPPPPPAPAKHAVEPTPEAARILARLNDHRRDLGLATVVPSAAKLDGAQRHADFVAMNLGQPGVEGLGLHDEDPALPGWSAEGAASGERAVIAVQGGVFVDPVDQWMATFYHRIPLVHPGLRDAGAGVAIRGRLRIVVLDASTDAPHSDVVVVPHDGAANVPVAFAGDELPNPIPDDADGRAGYPVTVTFPARARVEDVRVELAGTTGVLPIWVSTPEDPIDPRTQQNTVCVMAKDPLRDKSRYRFRIDARVDGRVFSRRTTFVTE